MNAHDHTSFEPVNSPDNDPIYKPAQTVAELTEAFALVYEVYIRCGFTSPNREKIRISHWNALPETITFIAKKAEQILSTLTLIPDSVCGLPAESSFREEIATLRGESDLLLEVSGLASRHTDPLMFLHLVKMMVLYAELYMSAHRLVVCVHPRHARFYTSAFKFQACGTEREHPFARNNPAVLLSLDLKQYRAQIFAGRAHRYVGKDLYDFIFIQHHENIRFPSKVAPLRVWNESLVRYFFCEKTDLFRKLTPQLQDFFQGHYGAGLFEPPAPQAKNGTYLDLEFAKY